MTKTQIDQRLKALSDYEMSLRRNTWDHHDRVEEELLKILVARSKLQQMLPEC